MFKIFPFIKIFSVFALYVSVSVSLTGCELAKNTLKTDRALNAEMQEYRDILAPSQDLKKKKEADISAGIPEMQPYVADDTLSEKTFPLVSVQVNQNVPLRDIFYELAQQANYDLELDPNITGSIIFTAIERPLDIVVDRLCGISGLRYNFDDDILHVEIDTPYSKMYKIDYVSVVRTVSGSVNQEFSVVSGSGADAGSSFALSSETEIDFWGSLEQGLTQLLGNTRYDLRTSSDPVARVEVQSPQQNPNASDDTGASDGMIEGDQEAVEQTDVIIETSSSGGDQNDGGMGGGDEAAGGSGGGDEAPTQFSINRQAGIVNVFASEKQHKKISEYLSHLKKSVTSQVLIEAKILEVSLNDEFSAGVDWNYIFNSDYSMNFGPAGMPIMAPVPNSAFTLTMGGNDLSGSLSALSRFGTVRALASPRVTSLNNQPAVLTVAENRVFFELDVQVTTDQGQSQTTVDSTINSVPEGIMINVLPTLNLDTKKIMLAVRPTITRVVGSVPDPGVAFVSGQFNLDLESLIPELSVQEVDTIMELQSGQTMVIGDRVDSTQTGVPVLSEMPLLGGMFRKQLDNIEKTELVILLKATIVEHSNVHDYDRKLYKEFSQDRRPLGI